VLGTGTTTSLSTESLTREEESEDKSREQDLLQKEQELKRIQKRLQKQVQIVQAEKSQIKHESRRKHGSQFAEIT